MAGVEEEKERKDVSRPKPSLPSNYVTLAQLQDRWLKEQARKKLIEEENEQLQRERLEQLEREKAELDRSQEYDVVKNHDLNDVAVGRRNDRPRQNRHHHQTEESRIESAVADDVAKFRDESEQMTEKKSKRNKKKRRKPRVDGLGTGGTNQVEPEEGKVEKVQVNVKEGRGKISAGTIEVEPEGKIEKVKVKGGTGKNKINGKHRGDLRKNHLVWEEKKSSALLSLHQMVEGLSVNGGKEDGSNDHIKKGSRWLESREPRDNGRKEGNVSSQEWSNGHYRSMVLREPRDYVGEKGNVSSQEGLSGHNRNLKGSEWSESRGRRDDGRKEKNVSSQDGSNGHHRRGSKWLKSRESRDSKFVWVKKGDVSDVTALDNAVQQSGTIMVDGRNSGEKKQWLELTQKKMFGGE